MKKNNALVFISIITPFLFSCSNADPHVTVNEEEFNYALSLSSYTHLQANKDVTMSLLHDGEEMKTSRNSICEITPNINHNISKVDGERVIEYYYKLHEDDPSKCDEAEWIKESGRWMQFSDLDASGNFKTPPSFSPVNFYNDLGITFNPQLSYNTVSLKHNEYVYVGEITLDGMKYPITLNLSFNDKVLLKYSVTYQMILESSYLYKMESITSLTYDTTINPDYPL